MRFIDNVPVWGTSVEEGALSQIKTCAQTAHHVALMADHHKGYAVPIGGVVAYKDSISPSGVGFDIGCGNKAVLTDLTWQQLQPRIKPVMNEIFKKISFGIGRANNERANTGFFDEPHPGWDVGYVRSLKDLARQQLGTVGSGNHYIDVFRDEKDRIWIGVHFGSRGFGHKIASHFLKLGGAKDGMDVPPLVLRADSDLGEQYIAAMELAGKYAYEGRDWVCSRVAATDRFWKKFITTTTLHGAKSTAANNSGWSGKALHLHSPARKALSAEAWGKILSSSKA